MVRDVEMFAFAGSGKKGWRDGPVRDCSFNAPAGVCECADGSIIVADTGNHCVRQIYRATAGKLVVRTVAGSYAPVPRLSAGAEFRRRGVAKELGLRANRASGYRDGLQALFRSPSGVIEGSEGEILVADTMNNCIRGLVPSADGRLPWEVRTVCGQARPGYLDGSCEVALFDQPVDLCWGKGRNSRTFFVSDKGNACIRQVGRSFEHTRPENCLAFTWVRTIELDMIPRAPRPGAFVENGDLNQSSYPLGLACLPQPQNGDEDAGNCTLVVCDGGENAIKLLPLHGALEKQWSVKGHSRAPAVTEKRAPSTTFSTERLEIGSFEELELSMSTNESLLETDDCENMGERQGNFGLESCSCDSSRALAQALDEIAALQTENVRLKELLHCTFDEIQLANERLSRNQQ